MCNLEKTDKIIELREILGVKTEHDTRLKLDQHIECLKGIVEMELEVIIEQREHLKERLNKLNERFKILNSALEI